MSDRSTDHLTESPGFSDQRDPSHQSKPPVTPAAQSSGQQGSGEAVGNWTPIVPAPDDQHPADPYHSRFGRPSEIWPYRNEDGQLLFLICRFDQPDGKKEVLPYTYGTLGGSTGWHWKAPLKPRPLYGLDRLAARPGAPVLVVEGEKAADAATELFPDFVAITSSGGSNGAKRSNWRPLSARTVTIWPDNDGPGRNYAESVARLATSAGAGEVHIVKVPEDWPNHWDLADETPAGDVDLEAMLRAAQESAEGAADDSGHAGQDSDNEPKADASGEYETPPEGPEGPYRETKDGIIWMKPVKGGTVAVPLTNFMARIVGEVERDDGVERLRHFELEARFAGRRRRFAVTAADFAGLSWVHRELGARAMVYPGFTNKDHARAAIQLLSPDFEDRTVFGHTGWREIDGETLYLHAGGAIGPRGPVPNVETDLTLAGLAKFHLPAPVHSDEMRAAIRASLDVLQLAPLTVTAPILAAAWRAPLGQSDFAVHVAGPTGAGKSELAALAQQHFGARMDRLHLPGSWSSTGNALEGQAFAAKDALLVVDDFAPSGTRSDVARIHREAARLLRAQGNNAGRARMRSDASVRPTKAPRGLVLSTGEDVPGGQSIRARTLVVEVGPDDLEFTRLIQAQEAARAGSFAQAMAGYLCWVAGQHTERLGDFHAQVNPLQDEAHCEEGHRRTAWIVAELGAALKLFLHFAESQGVLTDSEVEEIWRQCWSALLQVAEVQSDHQAADDPAKRFLSLLQAALASGHAHLGDAKAADQPPADPGAAGWVKRIVGLDWGDDDQWQPKGDRIGWISGDDIYLQPDAVFSAVQQVATRQGSTLAVGQPTLWKRLKEADLLASREIDRGRNTVRREIGGQRRRVLHLKRTTIFGERTGPTGPKGPESRNSAPAGPKIGADSGDADQETAPENGPDAAQTFGQGPEGPLGPLGGQDDHACDVLDY